MVGFSFASKLIFLGEKGGRLKVREVKRDKSHPSCLLVHPLFPFFFFLIFFITVFGLLKVANFASNSTHLSSSLSENSLPLVIKSPIPPNSQLLLGSDSSMEGGSGSTLSNDENLVVSCEDSSSPTENELELGLTLSLGRKGYRDCRVPYADEYDSSSSSSSLSRASVTAGIKRTADSMVVTSGLDSPPFLYSYLSLKIVAIPVIEMPLPFTFDHGLF